MRGTGVARRWIVAVTLAGLSSQAPVAGAQRTLALVGGTLIDGYGGPPLRNSVILIEGERIKAVGQVGTLAVPAGAEVVSTEGMSVLPGLWDMHVHLMINGHADYAHWDKTYPSLFESVIMPASARQLLMAGITSARDLGGPLQASLATRAAIRAGKIAGPTLYVSGPFLQHAPYPGTELFRWGVNGVADARGKVRRLADAGVDCIKLIDQDQMTMDEVVAIVDEAHRRQLPVVAHAHRPEEIRRGLQAGVDDFEHTGLAGAPEYPPDLMAMLKDRTARGAAGPFFWTPTIEGLFNYEYLRDNPERLDDPSWHLGLPDSIVADIQHSIAHPERLSYFQATPSRRPTLARKFQQLRESGAVLLIGTDAGIPMKFHSQATWNELDVWVNRLGVDPMVAIRAATFWPAVAMKVEKDVGTVSEGKYADVIAVRGDVLRYIDLLQRVDVVVKHGIRYR
ncbi:MAG: amidohydrolase family protein [Gemmatimonadaceae bacterium]